MVRAIRIVCISDDGILRIWKVDLEQAAGIPLKATNPNLTLNPDTNSSPYPNSNTQSLIPTLRCNLNKRMLHELRRSTQRQPRLQHPALIPDRA